MQPDGSAPTPGHDDDQTGWLLTFSDLVLQLFAFIIVAVVLGQRTVTATVVAAPAPPRPAATRQAPVPTARAAETRPVVARPADARPIGGPARRPTFVDAPLVAETLPAAAAEPDPAPVHEPVRDPIPEDDGPSDIAARRPLPAAAPAADPGAIDAAYAQLSQFLARTGTSRNVGVSVRGAGLTVTLGEPITFASARAALLTAATPVLDEITNLAATLPAYAIEISGHTDDTPIRSAKPTTNLDLSLARAAAVAHAITTRDPSLRGRVIATGYGETRPVASNGEAAGRARNRRVELRFVPIDAAAR